VRVVLATANRGKLRELEALLAPLGMQVIAQAEFGIEPIEETGSTFTENALIKARHAARHSGMTALADDSGLEVDSLDGRPGVHSARYAGAGASDADNVRKLLAELGDREPAQRTARFRCVLAMVGAADDPAPVICEGTWSGRIATAPAGDGGFGYDPVFVVEGTNVTAAQLPPERKNALSHRARALAQLGAALGALQSHR
jgi:XTP/dITP diphosphohydrolase